MEISCQQSRRHRPPRRSHLGHRESRPHWSLLGVFVFVYKKYSFQAYRESRKKERHEAQSGQ